MRFKLLAMLFVALTAAHFSLTQAQGKGDVLKASFNGRNEFTLNGSELADYFTWNDAKHSFNAKYKDCSYDGVDYTSGLKMEGATLIQWTQAAKADIVIVQSAWSDKTLKFDDAELDVTSAEAIDGGRVYKIADVLPGTHKVKRGSGESGVFCVTVSYTTDALKLLPAPSIDYDKTSGLVTIAGSADASKIVYTTDGTIPTNSSEVYTAPFAVEDGTIVKAMNVGDYEEYINGPATDTLIIIDGIKMNAPVVSQLNGTAVVTAKNVGASVEYSLDNGATWEKYYNGITFTADGTIQARATRENCEASDVVSADIKAFVGAEGTEKVVFQMDEATAVMDDGKGDSEIFTPDGLHKISMVVDGKLYAKGDTVFYNGEKYWTMKCSNGGANKITLAKEYRAVKLTLVSYVNGISGLCGWQEVAGKTTWEVGDTALTYTAVPTQAFTSEKDPNAKYQQWQLEPDVRIFPVDSLQEFTFTNKGVQLCFVAIVDVITTKQIVVFTDESGDTISSNQYKIGTSAYSIVQPTPPTKEGYDFAGWTPSISDVTADATYKATYTIKQHTVTFVDDIGRIISSKKYDHFTKAKDIETPTPPAKASVGTTDYTFNSWQPSVSDVTTDVTYRATYSSEEHEFNIIALECTNGSVATTQNKASTASLVTISVSPDEGYMLNEIIVFDQKGTRYAVNDTHTFSMPSTDVFVTASFIENGNSISTALQTSEATRLKAKSVYDLSGRSIATPSKGKIYVVDGKIKVWK